MSADDVIFANHSGISDLYQAVDLGALFHAGFSHGGAVNGSDGAAGLDDFVICAAGAFCEAEPVIAAADYFMQDDAFAKLAEFADYEWGENRAAADEGSDRGVGSNDGRSCNG